MGCVQAVQGKKKFLVQSKDGKNKEMSSCSIIYVCSTYEACLDMDEPISNLTKKEQGKLWNIDGYTDVEGPCMFDGGMYLSVFYCLCYVKKILMDMWEEKVSEERDPHRR